MRTIVMHKHKPMFYVFAGNNGSGKSTIRNLLIDKIGVDINIDPDAIARRIDPLDPESKRVSAGKEVIKSVYKHKKKAQIFLLRRHWRVVMLLDKYKKQKNKVIKSLCFMWH